MEPVTITLIAGRTGSGKSSIAKYLKDHYGMPQVVSHTTRPRRKGEERSTDHYFISTDELRNGKYSPDDIAAYTKIGEYEYFTTWETLEKCNGGTYVIDPIGIYSLKNAIKQTGHDLKLRIVYVVVDEDVRKKRIRERGDLPEVAEKRIADENEQFDEFEKYITSGKAPNVIVINNSHSLEEAVKEIV